MSQYFNDRGRGTVANPGNRFEGTAVEFDEGALENLAVTEQDYEPVSPETLLIPDDSQSIITKNSSPDLGFDASLNPYRGCEHGCSYCYARPYHEYLGFNAGLDFETKIMFKANAPALLEQQLASPRWRPTKLACSGVTDCYQPIEREKQITRSCLEVLAQFRNPVGIVTKNALVTRDIDVLQTLAHHQAAAVSISITSLDADLAGKLEPRASRPAGRLRAVREIAEAGIPVGVSVAPIIPGLNDHEIPAILEASADQGATFASYTVLRLPFGVKDIFEGWIDRHYPSQKEKILGRVREMRGGSLNQSEFGRRMKGEGVIAEEIGKMFHVSAQRVGLSEGRVRLSTEAFRRITPGQMELW